MTYIYSRLSIIKPTFSAGKEYYLLNGLAAVPDRCQTGATDKMSNDQFLFLFMILRITSQSQLCPNSHHIIMNNLFLPVWYRFNTEGNFQHWVTICQGASERAKKKLKYLNIKRKALAPRQHVLLPMKSSHWFSDWWESCQDDMKEYLFVSSFKLMHSNSMETRKWKRKAPFRKVPFCKVDKVLASKFGNIVEFQQSRSMILILFTCNVFLGSSIKNFIFTIAC